MSARILLLLTVLLQGCATPPSVEASRTLPKDVVEALAVVPADAQSLMATLVPFPVPSLNPMQKAPPPFADAARAMFFGGFDADDARGRLFATLEGARVKWAFAAKRRQDVLKVKGSSTMIELGVHPFESVTVARFAEPLPAAFTAGLRTQLVSMRTRSGVEAFRSRVTSDEKIAKSGPWAVMLAAPDTLVLVTTLSTDDAMLEDVAERIVDHRATRLFIENGAPWSQLRFDSTIWAFSRSDGRDREARAIGQEWMVFAHDSEAPQVGVFRSVLKDHPTPEARKRLAEMAREVKHQDLGFTAQGTTGPGFLELRVECLPGAENRCLLLPFILWARGIMVWI